MDTDPLFLNAVDADYRLDLCSPCVDAGDPDSDHVAEPEPNGNIINIGAFGNTADAAIFTELLRDNDGDGFSECWGDCNDADASIYPGAEDIPGDGIDQDCGGTDGPDDEEEEDDDDGSSGSTWSCSFSSSLYGTPLIDKLSILRKFRDRYLRPHFPGRMLIKFYYWSSPSFACLIERYEPVRVATRVALIPVIWACEILVRSPEAAFMITCLIGVWLGCVAVLLTLVMREKGFGKIAQRHEMAP
jgi:hypothetical protein